MRKTKLTISLIAFLLCLPLCGCHPGSEYTWSDSLTIQRAAGENLQIPIKALVGPSDFGFECGDEEFMAVLLDQAGVLEVQTLVEPNDESYGGVYGKTNGTYLLVCSAENPEQNICIFSNGKHTISGESLYTYQARDMRLLLLVDETPYTILFPIYLVSDIDELDFTLKPDTDYALLETVNAEGVISDFYGTSGRYRIEETDENTFRILPGDEEGDTWLEQPFEISIGEGTLRIALDS